MSKVKVTVKWRNQIFNDLELQLSEPLILFKQQLWHLTKVPPEKQKLMYKGLLKDDVDLSNLNIQQNDKIMLVGSAESLPEKPKSTIFVEDLTPAEKELLFQRRNINIDEQGIANLGNTCYFNVVLQFLNSFDDLMNFLKNYKKTTDDTISQKSKSLKKQFFDAYVDFAKVFGKSQEPIIPRMLLDAFRRCFPQFSERSPVTREYLHQDAEECLNAVLSVLNEMSGCNIVDKLFSFKTISKIRPIKEETKDEEKEKEKEKEKEEEKEKEKEKKEEKGKEKEEEENKDEEKVKEKEKESEEEKKQPEQENNTESKTENNAEKKKEEMDEEHLEEVQITEEFHTKLRCYMGNQLEPTKHMHEGIHLFFKEKIEKFCQKKNENVLFERMSEMDSLPPYLIVHFARFEWVQTTEGLQVKSGRAKICRKVNFSQNFDVFDFCSERLKKELSTARSILTKRTGEELFRGREKKEDKAENQNDHIPKEENQEQTNCQVKQDKEETEKEKKDKDEAKSDIIELYTGHYDLISVVTHTGRYATRGHYIAWKKLKEKNNDNTYFTNNSTSIGFKRKRKINDPTWLQFDDDKVTTHKFSSVDLTGGRSDYHIAFLLLFKRQSITCTQEELDEITNINKKEC